MKDGQKLKLGDAHVTPRYIQEVHASKLGDVQGIPIFINKTSGHFTGHYIFIASYTMCCSQSISCFCFQFSLVCLLQYLVGSQQYLFWRETHSVFIARTLQFSLSLIYECSPFASSAFSSCFPLLCCLELISFLILPCSQVDGLFLQFLFETCFK